MLPRLDPPHLGSTPPRILSFLSTSHCAAALSRLLVSLPLTRSQRFRHEVTPMRQLLKTIAAISVLAGLFSSQQTAAGFVGMPRMLTSQLKKIAYADPT